MENQTETRTTFLSYLKQAMLAIFKEKDEYVVNCLDEVENWKDVVNKKDTFSNEDREKINEILKAEKGLNERKNSLKSKLEEQVTRPEKRIKGKKFKIEEEHKVLDQIIENLKTICLENISKIFLQENAQKLLDEVSNKKVVETLLQNLSVEDVRLILIELINQNVSIKDNNYVMERMSVYADRPTLNEIITALKNDLV